MATSLLLSLALVALACAVVAFSIPVRGLSFGRLVRARLRDA